MKLPELKRRFKNKYVIRIAAGVLTVAVAGGSFGAYTVQAEKAAKTKTETTQEAKDEDEDEALEEVLSSKVSNSEEEVGKEETVYVVSDNTGKADTVIVSDWLKNPEGADTLEDASDLKDIKNVKGKEKYEEKDGKLVWNAKGNDIYYQGSTEKELPVEQTITYYLDGEKMDPEDIAGKSGKVTIRFDYKNNQRTTVKVDGKEHSVYVPFTVLTGMVLDDSYSNVEVKNGKVISDGDKQMVAGVAMPGLKSSLQVKSSDFAGDVEIPEYVEVTADVEDFKLDMTMSVMMSGIATGDDIEDLVDLSDLDDAIGTLSDSSKQLVDGTQKLKEGIELMKNSAPALASGANTLNSSTATLNSGIAELDATLNAPMSDEAKAAAAKKAAATVNAQKSDIEKQAAATVNAQADAIKKQAAATVEAQKSDIEKQAAATVGAQAEAIKKQAADTVKAQEQAIKDKTAATVSESFKAGTDTYNYIYNTASTQFKESMTNAQTISLVGNGIYQQLAQGSDQNTVQLRAILSAGVQAAATAAGQSLTSDQIAAQVDGILQSLSSQVANGAMNGVAAIGADTSAQAVVKACEQAAVQAAQQGAVTGAIEAAQTAAVSGAQQGAAQGAVAGATQAAQTAAISGAQQGAAQGAVAGATEAAQTAAVSGAEAAKAEIATAIETKTESGHSLVSGMEALKNGTQALADQVPTLINGINQLADGATTLNEGMIKFDQEGIQKLADTYNGDVKGLMEKVAAVMKAGSDYQTFSDKNEDTVGEVKFIIRTEGVEAKED